MTELGEPGRLARLVASPRNKWLIIVFWLLLAGACFAPAMGLTDEQENNVAAWLPGDAESTQVIHEAEDFGESPNAFWAVAIFQKDDGALTESDKVQIREFSQGLSDIDGVMGTPATERSTSDESVFRSPVLIDAGDGGWEKLGEVVTEIRDRSGQLPDDVSLKVGGSGGNAADQSEAFEGIDGILLAAAGAVVILALLLTYRSPVLWLLPMVSAAFSLLVAQAIVFALAKYADVTVNAMSAGILTVLVFGAGTDYALLLVARYREELRHHEDKHEAMALALHRAGPAIVASAVTVMIGLLCLTLADMNSSSGLGPVCAVGVLVALGAMLSLLPSLLLVTGRRIFWPVRPSYGSDDHFEDSVWARIGTRIAKVPRPVWIGTTLMLGALALGNLSMDAKGLNYADTFVNTPESVKADEINAASFKGASTGDPLMVIANAQQADAVKTALSDTPGVLGDRIQVIPSDDGRVMLLAPMTAPVDSPAGEDTVTRVRDRVHDINGADAIVGGVTAQRIDANDSAARDNRVVIPLVLLVVLLILGLLLRAVVAPIILLLTVVISYGAALGISSLLFSHVFGFEGADATWPLLTFVFLVALGIDYNIFLMTRVHEETKRVGTRSGALIGLRATGGVITSAGFVLAGTFAVMSTLPVVFMVELGVTVALGVLLDTLIVRSVLVTALTLDIGRWMWWPSALFRKEAPDARPESEKELAGV